MQAFPFFDLLAAGLLEQHRWEVGCEAFYRRGLRGDSVDPAILHHMLRTFGVARTIQPEDRKQLARVLPALAREARQCGKDWSAIFKAAERLGIRGVTTRNGAQRSFVSGLTKVLWFAGGHCLPMFDSWTCKAVRPCGKGARDKAVDFYCKLQNCDDGWDVGEAILLISDTRDQYLQDWRLRPERLVDKLLLIKALSRESDFASDFIFATDRNRSCYLETLSGSARKTITALVVDLGKSLSGTRFGERLAP